MRNIILSGPCARKDVVLGFIVLWIACFARLQPQCKTGQRSERSERRRERPQGANVASLLRFLEGRMPPLLLADHRFGQVIFR
jgi:hypothetical protein